VKYFAKAKISRSDLKQYPLIGDGKDGEVYKIADDVCVKYFFLQETHQKELEAIKIGQSSKVIPKLYEHGENYIVMEFVQGISLARYLKNERQITPELTKKILAMLDELKRIGFKRLDTEIRHVLINNEGQLKVIDHKRAFTSENDAPTKLMKGFKKFGLTHAFLGHVKSIDPSAYADWSKRRIKK
jgi:putative serine/threonine protein kinase